MRTTDDQSEIFDVVDAENRVIGTGTRADIHAQNLRHRSVHILLKNSSQEVFVQLRSLTKDNNPGLWDSSAAGHVDSGESYPECACRELLEELNVRVGEDDLEYMFERPATVDNGYEFQRIYCVESSAEVTLHPQEVADGRWIAAARLHRWLQQEPQAFTDDFRDIWCKAIQGGFVALGN